MEKEPSDHLVSGIQLDPHRFLDLTQCLCSLLAGIMFSCMDTSIMSTALVAMSEDFRDSFRGAWVVLAYLLTYMSMFCCPLLSIHGV
jgi:MFS family permease